MKIKVFNIRLSDKHLEHDQNQVNNFLAQVEMKKSTSTLVSTDEHFWSLMIHYKDKAQGMDAVQEIPDAFMSPTSTTESKPIEQQEPEQKPKTVKISLDDLTEEEINMLNNLKSWRADKAQQDKVPPFVILWDRHLIDAIKAKPSTPEELMEVKGFSTNRVNKYGVEILNILGAF